MAQFPETADDNYKQVIIRAGLEVAYQDLTIHEAVPGH